MKTFLRLTFAIIIAELILIVLITLFQEVLANGVILGKSSLKDLLIGGLGTLIAGFLAAILASILAKKNKTTAIIILSCLVVIETTYLILTGKINNPIWFDVLAAILLIGSFWIGLIAYNNYVKKLNYSLPNEKFQP